MTYTKEELRKHLLETSIFEENLWFEAYISLVAANITTKPEKFKTQSHHIVPKYYFISNNLQMDNSEANLVTFLFKDHVLAHYYLAKCSINQYKYSNEVAFFTMSNRKRCNIDEIKEIDYNELQLLYEDFCKHDSEMNSGENNGNFGHHWTAEQKLQASISQKQYYAEHPEAREKIRNGQKGKELGNKGKRAFYDINGNCIYADTCPEGYTDQMPPSIA